MVSFQVALSKIPERLSLWVAGWQPTEQGMVWDSWKSPQQIQEFRNVEASGQLFVYATFNGKQTGPIQKMMTAIDDETYLVDVSSLEERVTYPQKRGSILPWLVGAGAVAGVIALAVKKK